MRAVLNPAEAILYIAESLCGMGVSIKSVTIDEVALEIARNGRSDDEIDILMRTAKVMILTMGMLAGIPIHMKFKYRIVRSASRQDVLSWDDIIS